MENSKLVEAFSTLSYKEQKKFKAFIKSPFYNEKNEVIRLAYHLFDSRYRTRSMSKRKLYAALFPGTEYDDLQLRHLISELYRLLEKFMALREFERDPLNEHAFMLKAFRKLKLSKHFSHIYRRADKLMERSDGEDMQYWLNRFRVLQQIEQFDATVEPLEEGNHLLPKTLEALDDIYILGKLQTYSYMDWGEEAQMRYGADLDRTFTLAKKPLYYTKPAIRIYYHLLGLQLENEKEGHFTQLLDALAAHPKTFDDQEMLTIYNFAINYCLHRHNEGAEGYLRKVLSIYEIILDKGWILENGKLSVWNFEQIVELSIRIETFDWAVEFIDKYKRKLLTRQSEEVVKINSARLYYAAQEYEKVVDLIDPRLHKTDYQPVEGSILLIKALLELEMYEDMQEAAEIMRIYLLRDKKLSNTEKQQYQNMLKFIDQSMEAHASGDDMIVKSITKAVNETEEVAEKEWLQERLLGAAVS